MMISDFHSHILPDIDDGSRNLEESLQMLHLEAKQGIQHVVATPHFYAHRDTIERFLKKRQSAEAILRESLLDYPELPEVHIGAEVYYFRGISSSDRIPELTIDKKSCILIEMPHGEWTGSMYQELELLYTRFGLTPIIAHIDRYLRPFQGRKSLERLADLPVLVQANADFFLNKSTANRALRMLKQDQIQLLGSDCHNLTSRKPNLGPALERIRDHGGKEALNRVVRCQKEFLGW